MKTENEDLLSKLLSSVNSSTLKELLHRCGDQICGRRGPSGEHLSSSLKWSSGEYQTAIKLIEEFLCDAVVANYNAEKVHSVLRTLSDEQIQSVVDCLSVRINELRHHIVISTAARPSTVLGDFDWKVKWAVGSSSLSSLEEPYLDIDFNTRNFHGPPFEINKKALPSSVNVELSKDELNNLITALESVESSLPQ